MISAIRTRNLCKSYAGQTAVANVNLNIPRGEIYGLLGPNGAGKTTIVRMLCTLLSPTEGEATVAGWNVIESPTEVRLRIGAALQATAIDKLQTGREMLYFQARLYGIQKNVARKRIKELEDLMELGEAVDKRVSTYSGGMKRRLDIALAMLHRPPVLILDEPTTGLDPRSRMQMWDEVRRLNQVSGTTIILTTQYLDEADQLADRIGVICNGAIVAEGSPLELKHMVKDDLVVAEISGDPHRAAQFLGGLPEVKSISTAGNRIEARVAHGARSIGPIAVGIEQAGVNLNEITLRTPTLDDVFLKLTGGYINKGTGYGTE